MLFFVVLWGILLFILWVRTSRLKRQIAELRQAMQRRELAELRQAIPQPAPQPQPVQQPAAERAPQPPPPPPVTPPPPPATRQPPPPPPPPPGPSLGQRLRKLLDVEQMLGSNWLSKIGVAILVLGIAFFLAWQLRELGPAGKMTVGTLVALALLGSGIWAERTLRYRILGRAALAGGWSLLFFVAYAAHHIPASRVIESELTGFVLMLAVVAAMVSHTLRFRSQVVTGLAFGIAFATVGMNRVDVYSLTANVALAIGFAAVVLRMRWFALEILGILATYLNHYVWLVPIIMPMEGKVHAFPQFYPSATILLLYWAVFRASYVIREPVDEKTSAIAGVLNSAMLAAVMKYQSVRPDLAFRALLIMGAVELVLSRLPIVRRKRTTFIVLTTLGVTLMVAAIPFKYAATSVSPLWLLEATLLLVVGIVTAERIYCRLASIAALATAVQMISYPGARLLGMRLGPAAPERAITDGAIFLGAMLLFYAAAEWVPLRWFALFDAPLDLRLTRYISYAAAVMGLIGAYALTVDAGTAVCWSVLALLLTIAGQRFKSIDLSIEGSALAVAAVIRALVVNLPSNSVALPHMTWRFLTVAIVIACVYAMALWIKWSPFATWTASALLGLLVWYEFLPISVAVAWTIAAVILIEIGVVRDWRHLRWQAYALLGAAFVRVFVVNMNAAGMPRLYTILPIVVGFLFVYERLHAEAFAWLAATSVVALLRFQLGADAVAIAWAALVLLLVAFASFSGRRVFLHIAEALSVVTLVRAVIHNLYERSYFPPPASAPRWLIVAIVCALLFAALPFAFRLRRAEGRWFDRRPEQILFFVPLVLMTVLLATEMRKGMLTVAWGVEAVVVFLAALWIGERSYRLSGVGLLLLCVGKIFVFDFWTLSLRDKALTGIIVGVALIGVSILYTRKKEAILQFL